MSTWNAVMTTAGLALQAKLVAGATLTITKAQAGAGTVATGNLASQTAVSSVKQTLNLRYVQANAGTANVACYLTNDKITTSYTVKQVGIFANDPDNGEILYFIAQASGDGTDVPSNADMPGFTAEWVFSFAYGQASSVSITVDPANTVSQAQAQVMINTALSSAQLAASQITSGILPAARGGTGTGSIDTAPTSGSKNVITSGAVYTAVHSINASQITGGTLPVSRGGTGNTSVDTTPTSGSTKMVTSGGVYTALHAINASQITGGTLPVSRGGTGNTSVDTTPTSGSTKMVTSGGVYTALAKKQSTITYGTAAPSGGSNGDVYVRYS